MPGKNLKPHEQYKRMLRLMVSSENANSIDAIVIGVAKEYKLDPGILNSDLGFCYGITYKIVVLLARLAKEQGLKNFWLGN